jgi:hypothetical protein
MDTIKTANGRVVLEGMASAYATAIGSAVYKGRVNFPRWKCSEPSANLSSNNFYLQFTTADTSKTFKLGVSAPRIVNLTQASAL